MIGLVGSGEYLSGMDAVDRELLDLFDSTPNVVCIPAAAGREGDAMIDDWMNRGVDHFNRLGANATGARVWDRSTADDAAMADRVAAADFVYLSGGNPAYLHETLESTRVWSAILEVIGRGGLLVGCSAGAMIQGERFMGGLRPKPGFGLWPGVLVIPHFDEIPNAVVASMRLAVGKRQTIVGVNGNTALLQDDDEVRVLGNEVTVWTADDRTTHGPGPLPPGLLPA